jgi:L-fucose isomerase-like protein
MGKVGVVCVGVPWFDIETARSITEAVISAVRSEFEVVADSDIVTCYQDAEKAMNMLRDPALDCMVLEVGTFPDGEAIQRLAACTVPIVVHFVQDSFQGGTVERNSQCGAGLTSYCLRAMSKRYLWTTGDVRDPAGQQALLHSVRSAAALGALRRLRIGAIGRYPPGFLPSAVDDGELQRLLGVTISDISVAAVVRGLDTDPAPEAVPMPRQGQTLKAFHGGRLPEEVRQGIERWFRALSSVMKSSGIAVFAIKDWPELLGDLSAPGLWPCLGWLQDSGFIVAPEGDLNAALTMAVASSWTQTPTFLADVVGKDEHDGTLTLWHYGCAESLARDPDGIRYLEDGHDVEFTLRPGRGILFRLGRDGQGYRVLSVPVEVVPEPVRLRRAACKVRPIGASGSEVLEALLNEGWDHHVCLVYGEVEREAAAFARCAGFTLSEM